MKEKKSDFHNDPPGSASHESGYHVPVLFYEAIEALNINPAGIYVDCTYGGGGHSLGILQKLEENGKLIVFDQDADAARNLPKDERVIFIPENFRHLERFLRLHKLSKVDGVLADLGVSSHQFDEPGRGFSTRFDGPLDMRMDQRQERTAAMILQTYTESQLHRIFEQYGEVTNSKTLARYILAHRKNTPLKTIGEFKNFLRPVIKGNPNKYLAQVFQALRIEVNDEMNALKEMLSQLPGILKSGGRVVIITFHSGEDRLVKNFFKHGSFTENEENPFEQREIMKELKVITKKPKVASSEELKKNPRSRSAKLRVAERL